MLRLHLQSHRTPSSDEDMPDPNVTQDNQGEPSDAGSPRRPRRPKAPDLEDALTRLTQTVERMAAIQRPQQAVAAMDIAEDPDFNWNALRSPLEATFPLQATGVVQRIAAGLFAKVQTGVLTSRDQREARFVLDIIADWPDMDADESSNGSTSTRLWQRMDGRRPLPLPLLRMTTYNASCRLASSQSYNLANNSSDAEEAVGETPPPQLRSSAACPATTPTACCLWRQRRATPK